VTGMCQGIEIRMPSVPRAPHPRRSGYALTRLPPDSELPAPQRANAHLRTGRVFTF